MKHTHKLLFIAMGALPVVGFTAAVHMASSSGKDAQRRLDDVCRNVQITLRLDAREIRKGGPLKQQVISRVFSEDHAGDGATTLSACLTTPFDIDAWSSCKLNSDDACLARILDASAASIAYGQ